MNAAQLAREVGIGYPYILQLLKGGKIPARKEKNRWELTEEQVDALLCSSCEKASKLEKTYLRLYWEGLSIQALQQKAVLDFEEQGILLPAEGFVEKTIYEDSLKDAIKERT